MFLVKSEKLVGLSPPPYAFTVKSSPFPVPFTVQIELDPIVR